ncbi:MAG: sortase [Anaerolineales bacterium]
MIAKANTTLAITSDTPDPSFTNAAVTVNFSITSAGNTITPTGNVTVSDGVNSCTGTVTGATSPFTGSCIITLTTAGARTLTASYPGDANFNAPTNATAAHTVNVGFVITASAGTGGTITPSGAVGVTSGGSQAFESVPNANFVLADLLVDGSSVGKFNNYTLTNILANGTIAASFDGGWSAPTATTSNGCGGGVGAGYSSNNTFATCGAGNAAVYQTFNLTVPAGSTIDGIEVAVEGHTSGRDIQIALSQNGGANYSTPRNAGYPTSAADQTVVIGGSTDNWGLGALSAASFSTANFRVQAVGAGGGGTFSLDQLQVKVHYRQPTTLVVSAATGTYGGTVNLTGTLTNTVGGAGVSGETVTFYLNGVSVGTAVTNASGVATLNGASLGAINVGTYAGVFNTSGVTASYAGTAAGAVPSGYLSSNAVNTLIVNKASLTVTANPQSKTYGNADPAFTFGYSAFQGSDTASVIDTPPTCTVVPAHINFGTYPITCSGGVDNNYSFTYVGNTLTINKRAITVNALTDTKVYDGTTSSTVIPSVAVGTPLAAGDTPNFTQAFDTKDVGTGKTLTASGSVSDGNGGANYTITFVDDTTGVITKLDINVTGITASNKTYDGNTTATLNVAGAALATVIAPDVVTLDTSAAVGTFADANVGAAKTVTISGITIGGADAGNYNLIQPSTTADITARALTVTATGVNKVYDGNATATVTLSDNRVVGDTLTLNYGSASFADKNVGVAKTVSVTGITVTGADAGNYTFNTTDTTSADITAFALIVNATGVNKVYDGNTTATVNLSDNRILGDVLTLGYTSASFADAAVGVAKPVSVTGITVTGADAGNYTFNTTDTTSADITARLLTVSATGNDKVYDGNTTATVNLSDDRIVGDVLTLSYASASFADANVGVAKSVSVTGINVTGADAGNYTFNTTASTTADITARVLTVNATGINKVYDGNTTATVNLSDDRVVGDTLTLSYASASFADANIGIAKPVSVTGINVTGADAGNYTFNTTDTTSADITARALTVNATGINKVYDGNTTATVNLSDNRVVGDTLTLSYASASFADAAVGVAKPVSVTGINVTGADAGNYTFNTTDTTSADITAFALTVSATGVNKVYDGNTTATVTLADNRIVGDTLTISYTSASFADPNVGAAKPVSVTGISVTGADAGNYTFNTTDTTSADITARALTVNATGVNKVYDGNTTATVSLSDNRVVGDVLTLGYTSASFADAAVGAAKPVSVTGITVTGADAGNYTFNTTDTTSADITAFALIVNATGVNKVYDGNTTATVTLSDNRIPGDTLTLNYASATFANKNVGVAKAVSVTGITVTGADASNYTFNTTDTTSADITARPIEITAITDTKAYDSNTSSVGIPTLTAGTLAPGDNLGFIQTFDTANVGINKTLTPSGAVQDGNSGNNYAVTFVDDNTGVITGITVTVNGITANNKIYDGNTTAILNTVGATLSGVVPGDTVTLDVTGAAGDFVNKNVANGKVVNVSGLALGGADAANYSIIMPSTVANITTRAITVTAQTNSKAYDGNTSSAAVPSITTGTLALGDTANFTQTYDTQNVGTSKTLTPSGAVTDGNGGGNYLVTFVNNTTGVITAQPLTITADPKAKGFGDPDPALTYSITNGSLIAPDFLSGSLTRVAGETVGTYAIQQGSLTAGSNYTITFVGANLTIANVNQTITVITPAPATSQYNSSFNVAATSNSGLLVAITTTGACTGSGTTTATIVMISGSGACVIHYNQPGNINFTPALEVTETVAAQKADQTISVNTSAPASAVFNTGFNVSATATSGLAVTYTSTGVCTNVGSNYTMTSGTGVCTVQYDQAGNANYNAAPQVTQTVNAQKAGQTINVTTSAPASAGFNSNFTVASNATSGLAVTYTSAGACTNAGATYTMTSATGTCTVNINQAGNANYSAAPQVTQSVTAQKANQTINVTTSAPANAAIGDVFTVAANSTSGGPITYSATGSCTNVGATFTVTSSVGSCTVHYNQVGNANYNAAPEVTESTNSLKANQTINVTTPAPANAVYNSSFTVVSNATSGLAVTYTSVGACTNVGATYTMTSSTGTCTVQMDQAGNGSYNAAPQVVETVTAQKANQTINVTTSAPGNAGLGSNFTVAATSTSGLPVAYSATGSCSNVGANFTMTSGAGTCVVHYNQAGDANYNAATEVTENTTAAAGSQTINVTTHGPASAGNGTSFNVAATASSGLPVTITSTGSCSGSGTDTANITITSAIGTCVVHYNQAGNASYTAAPEVTDNVAAAAASQAITIGTHAPANASLGSNFNVAATSNSGLTVAFTVTGGACSIVDHGNGTATVTITSTTGTCTTHYNQAGNASFAAAPELTDATVVDSTAPTVTINQDGAQADPTNASPINFTVVFSETVTGFGNGDITIGGTAGATTAVVSGAGPTYTVAVSGMTNDGTVTVSIPANIAQDTSGNPNFASSSTDNTVTYFDGVGPAVAVDGVNTSANTGDGILKEAEIVRVSVNQFSVRFTQDVYNPAGDSDKEDVTNPNNYILVRDLGDTAGYQTVSCAAGAVTPADTKIDIGTVTYNQSTFTATFSVNSNLPLSNGNYRLFVCGTTSIVDPLNNALALVGNGGANTDFLRNFVVNIAGGGGGGGAGGGAGGGGAAGGGTTKPTFASGAIIPVTGFTPGVVTELPKQPASLAYKDLGDMRLEIPSLGVNIPIVGVKANKTGWDLTWLAGNAGYLEGSAYPTWNGNTVLTGHVQDARNAPGPFAYINELKAGDAIYIHSGGWTYVYKVQETMSVAPDRLDTVFQHEDYDWLTLVTCENFSKTTEKYLARRVVRAILIGVRTDQ